MSSGLALGFGSPASCISSKAKDTLTTFSSNDWNMYKTNQNYIYNFVNQL